MKIAYNPKTAVALSQAPQNNDITFDLSGLNIFARGVRFQGTDTTYSVFKKLASDEGGYDGLVPAPSYTATNTRFLREDGTWTTPTAVATSAYIQLTNENLDDLLEEGKWYYAAYGNLVTGTPDYVFSFELYIGRNGDDFYYLKLITEYGFVWYRQMMIDSTWSDWMEWKTTDMNVLLYPASSNYFLPVILGAGQKSDPTLLGSSICSWVHKTTSIYALPSTGSLWATNLNAKNVTADAFIKNSSSDDYVLLGGGGHKKVSDFLTKSEELTNNLTTITKTLTVTLEWMDTGITGPDLPSSGTYIVQVYCDSFDSISDMYYCLHSGIMSWLWSATNDTETDEIILHRAGHAYGRILYLRTVMTESPGHLKLLIAASSNMTEAYNFIFKFKKVI